MRSATSATRYERLKEATSDVGIRLARINNYAPSRPPMPQSPSSLRHLLRCNDFIKLAEQVHDRTFPGSPLPRDVFQILTSLEFAIDLRRKQSAWTRRQAALVGFSVSESDRTHQHMIDTLVRCQVLMNDAVEKAEGFKAAAHDSSSRRKAQLSTAGFDMLSDKNEAVETETYAVQLPERLATVEEKTTAKVEVEVETGLTDADAFWSLLEQCQQLRAFAIKQWSLYINSSSTIFVASKARSMDSQLMRMAIDDFHEEFPKSKLFEQLMQGVQFMQQRSRHSDVEVERLVCLPAVQFLLQLRQAIALPKSQQPAALGRCGSLHPQAAKITENIPWLQKRAGVKAGTSDPLEELDPLLAAVIRFLRNRHITLYLVALVQMHLVMPAFHDRAASHAFDCLGECARRTKQSLKVFDDYTRSAQDQSESGKQLRRLVTTVDILANSDLRTKKKWTSPQCALLEGFPSLCGAILERLVEWAHLDGIHAASLGSKVVAAAHLYRAYYKSFGDVPRWSDMDQLVARQGKAGVGFTHADDQDVDLLGLVQQYAAAMGATRSECRAMDVDHASSLRVDLHPASSRAAVPRFSSRYLQLQREELKTHRSLDFASENIARRVLERLARALLDDTTQAQGAIDPAVLTQWKKERQLSQAQVLEIFVAHLKHEELELYFDHHGLAKECSELLDVVDWIYSGKVQVEGSYFGDLSLPDALAIVQGILFESCYLAETRTEHAGEPEDQLMLQQVAGRLMPYCEEHGGKRMGGAREMLNILMLKPLVGIEAEEARAVNPSAATVEDAEDDGS